MKLRSAEAGSETVENPLASVCDPRDLNLESSRQNLKELHISTGQVRDKDDPSTEGKAKVRKGERYIGHNNGYQSSLIL